PKVGGYFARNSAPDTRSRCSIRIPRVIAPDAQSLLASILGQLRGHALQLRDEVAPAVARAPVGGLVLRPEARLLHAHARAAGFRRERPRHDRLQAAVGLGAIAPG